MTLFTQKLVCCSVCVSRSSFVGHYFSTCCVCCCKVEALAYIAMNPAYHEALSEADIPDCLMQLLLPSDEWYYTNHTTK